MKQVMLAVFLVLFGAASVKAQTPTVWQGVAELATVTSQCAADGTRRGQYYTSVLRPANIGDNGPETRITFVAQRSMSRIVIAGQNFVGNGSFTGTHLSSRGGQSSYTGFFEVIQVIPATVTATTMYVQINGRYTNFLNTTGCTVFVRSTYDRRLN